MKNELEKLPKDIYRRLINDLYDGVYFVTKTRKILFWNKRAAELSGFKKKELLGKYCYDNILQHIDKNGKKLCLTKYCPLLMAIKTNKPCVKRVYLRRKDGVRMPVDVHTKPIRHHSRNIGAVEVFRDASVYERVERQRERAKDIALLDVLTSLPNRRYINKKMKLELNKIRKYKDNLYVAIADIDHFKKINDTYGHKKGDLVLRKIAYILDHNLRAVDSIGRYGGEEFLIVLPNTLRNNSFITLERIRNLVMNSRLMNSKSKVTISIGAVKAMSKDSPETVFKRADKALYKAKRMGRNRIEFA